MMAKSSWLTVFIKKKLTGPQPHSFICVLSVAASGLLALLSSCDKDCLAHKA